MRSVLLYAFFALSAAFTAVIVNPASAAAQCQWGCLCEGNSCGCNQRGSGANCALGGTGCVVGGCTAIEGPVSFAPDGSVTRLSNARMAALDKSSPSPTNGESTVEEKDTRALSGTLRWEYGSDGRSVLRHCSGIVVGRYYDGRLAASIRERSKNILL